jgi:cytochrome c oxidase subunit 2
MKICTGIRSKFISALMLFCLFTLTAQAAETPKTIQINAKRYEFTPSEIVVKKGVPVVLQLSTEDRSHGFSAPDFDIRTDIMPGKSTEVKLLPTKVGKFDFFCDIFCGSGHESMLGKIIVVE